jgi:hypothetical protein
LAALGTALLPDGEGIEVLLLFRLGGEFATWGVGRRGSQVELPRFPRTRLSISG